MSAQIDMDDFWKVLKGGLILILAAVLCGIAFGSCRAAMHFIEGLSGR